MSVLYVCKLYNNEPIIFDLTNEANQVVCKTNRDHTVSNVSHFTRTCKCIRQPEYKLFID